MLDPGCMGLYHCGQDRIELLKSTAMESTRSDDGSLALVPAMAFYESIIAHELAHAAFGSVPCPFENCATAKEVVAHTMRVMSLPPQYPSRFNADLGLDRKVARDEISIITLYLAPDVVLRKAWRHLNQRPDIWAYIDQIMSGNVRIDHAHPLSGLYSLVSTISSSRSAASRAWLSASWYSGL